MKSGCKIIFAPKTVPLKLCWLQLKSDIEIAFALNLDISCDVAVVNCSFLCIWLSTWFDDTILIWFRENNTKIRWNIFISIKCFVRASQHAQICEMAICACLYASVNSSRMNGSTKWDREKNSASEWYECDAIKWDSRMMRSVMLQATQFETIFSSIFKMTYRIEIRWLIWRNCVPSPIFLKIRIKTHDDQCSCFFQFGRSVCRERAIEKWR